MPSLPPRPCTAPRCRAYAVKDGRCDKHQREPWSHNGKTAAERGYGYKWTKLRAKVLKRDGHLCQNCLQEGIYTQATQVDHVIPKFLGGDDRLENCSSICDNCHTKKTANESKQGRTQTPQEAL